MAFIKYSDGKINAVVKQEDLTDKEKEALKLATEEALKADKSNNKSEK